MLSPLPQFPQWQGAAGTAVMRATASQQLMVVTLHAPRQPGFYEVWLLARDGVSMISLGDLNAGHTGTFVIPPGTDLHNYSRIDISLQPFDGSTQHSKTSVVRGSLPPPPSAAPPRRAEHGQNPLHPAGPLTPYACREPRPSAAGMEWTCECSSARQA